MAAVRGSPRGTWGTKHERKDQWRASGRVLYSHGKRPTALNSLIKFRARRSGLGQTLWSQQR